jgi:hypothetical protein
LPGNALSCFPLLKAKTVATVVNAPARNARLPIITPVVDVPSVIEVSLYDDIALGAGNINRGAKK